MGLFFEATSDTDGIFYGGAGEDAKDINYKNEMTMEQKADSLSDEIVIFTEDTKSVTLEGSGMNNSNVYDIPSSKIPSGGFMLKNIEIYSDSAAVAPCGLAQNGTNSYRLFLFNVATSARSANIKITMEWKKS